MSRSHAGKHRSAAPVELPVLRERVRTAITSCSFQAAREQAKELFRRDPTDEHRALLVEATAGRAAQLRRGGSAADAATILRSVADSGVESDALVVMLARELMLVGEWNTIRPVCDRVKGRAARAALEAAKVDAAVLAGPAGLARVPSEFQPIARAVLDALEAVAASNDAATLAAVAGIAPKSAAGDWRHLIEGLVAFYGGDSKTAAKTWKRLDASRPASAIAAPLRAQSDPKFLRQLEKAGRSDIADRATELTTEPWITLLESAAACAAAGDFTGTLLEVKRSLEKLPADRADLRERLGRALYADFDRIGEFSDIAAYRQLFGAPASDPSLLRLRAVLHDSLGDVAQSQRAWLEYADRLERDGVVRPDEANLARAMIWRHIGELADSAPPSMGPIALLEEFSRSPKLEFDAETCFRRAIELAPKYLRAHERLIDVLHDGEDVAATREAVEQLLQQFPEHDSALSLLAELAASRHDYAEAISIQERAVRARPHEPVHRNVLGQYRFCLARQFTRERRFDEARALVRQELDEMPPAERHYALCRLAATEYFADNAAGGDDFFRQACLAATNRLVPTFLLLAEAHRLPLDQALTMALQVKFDTELARRPDVAIANELAGCLISIEARRGKYLGYEPHRDAIKQYLCRAMKVDATESQLITIAELCRSNPADRLLHEAAALGKRRFPLNPNFPMFQGVYFMALKPPRIWDAVKSLRKAEKLAEHNPEYASMRPVLSEMLHFATTMSRVDMLSHVTESLFPGGVPFDLLDDDDLDAHDEPDELDELDDADESPARRGGRSRRSQRR